MTSPDDRCGDCSAPFLSIVHSVEARTEGGHPYRSPEQPAAVWQYLFERTEDARLAALARAEAAEAQLAALSATPAIQRTMDWWSDMGSEEFSTRWGTGVHSDDERLIAEALERALTTPTSDDKESL
jgi:hypothetical protein